MDVIKMIDAFTTYLANFNRRFESSNTRTQSYRISPETHVTCGWRSILMHDHLLCSCINISNVLDHRFMHHIMHWFLFIACFFYKFCFVLVFVDLTLLVLFLSVFKKVKNHKNWKIFKKFDHLFCVYHMWVWPSTFVLMV